MAIEYEKSGRSATITINRPQARNAVNAEVARGIEEAIDRLEHDDDVWAGIITGAPPVFCAGADLKSISAGEAHLLSTERGGFAGIVRRRRTKPLIAAVDGPALAGGTEIVLACDLVVASHNASFGIPEAKRGLLAAAGALFRLPQKLPMNVAMECALTGDPISAELAHRHGLVNELCEPGQAMPRAQALSERITANAPLALRYSRSIMLAVSSTSEKLGWELTDAAREKVMSSDDVREGVDAFLEKRAPAWTGR